MSLLYITCTSDCWKRRRQLHFLLPELENGDKWEFKKCFYKLSQLRQRIFIFSYSLVRYGIKTEGWQNTSTSFCARFTRNQGNSTYLLTEERSFNFEFTYYYNLPIKVEKSEREKERGRETEFSNFWWRYDCYQSFLFIYLVIKE